VWPCSTLFSLLLTFDKHKPARSKTPKQELGAALVVEVVGSRSSGIRHIITRTARLRDPGPASETAGPGSMEMGMRQRQSPGVWSIGYSK
jgi:hypothetical protein